MTLLLAHHILPSTPLHETLKVQRASAQSLRECILTHLWIAASHKAYAPEGWYVRAAEAYVPTHPGYHGMGWYMRALAGFPDSHWVGKMLDEAQMGIVTAGEGLTNKEAEAYMAWAARLVWSFDYENYDQPDGTKCWNLLNPANELRRLLTIWGVEAEDLIRNAARYASSDDVTSLLHYTDELITLHSPAHCSLFGNKAGLIAKVLAYLTVSGSVTLKDLHEDSVVFAQRYRKQYDSYHL